jgi:peptidyl-prolyl cis-trans isomerase C
MNTNSIANASKGCGGGHCQCAGQGAAQEPVASINGIALHAPGRRPDTDSLREQAYAELLRQEAVRQGLLARHTGLEAPDLLPHDQEIIEAMLDRAVPKVEPTESECQRYYEAHKARFVQGRQAHVRHILFAVTDGVDVHALAVRAEKALLELIRKDVAPTRFAELARELSNCPSSAQGGDLGWIAPEECADELANELFFQKNPQRGMGLHPRLVHSRHGLHIVDMLGLKIGRQLSYEEVAGRIAAQLAQQSQARALHQYMLLLAGDAQVEGVPLDMADTPLVQ